jgi:hypothetical protein
VKEITKEDIKQMIVSQVVESQGCRATELVCKIAATLAEGLLERGQTADFDVVEILEECVEAGHILEVSYVLPSMEYRSKQLYFPKGTKFEIKV